MALHVDVLRVALGICICKHAFDYATRDVKTCMLSLTTEPTLVVRDVKVVEAMYSTKNKYFDKHPFTKDLACCLTGDSILFSETTEDWKKSRKAISPAFYKGKLENLIDIARDAIRITLDKFKIIAEKGGK